MDEIIPNPRQKSNRIIIIVILVVVLLCLILCAAGYSGIQRFVADFVKVDPDQAKNLARQITDYDLPPGYKEMGGTSIFGVVTAAISDANEKNTIWLVQASSDNLPAPDKFLHDAIAYQRNNPITWTVDDVEIFTIRGEKSAITKYNGVTQDGKKYHAWAGTITGKGGPGLIVIVGPEETWDENVAKTFINSMR